MTRPARIAWISPFPPQASGVAAYACEVLALLRTRWDIETFRDGEMTGKDEEKVRSSDLALYHVGNNACFHSDAYRLAMRHPGIVILHDLCCHHLVADLTLARGHFMRYLNLCWRSDGTDGWKTAVIHWLYGFQETLGFRILCVKPLLKSSMGVLVHSQWAKRKLESICPNAHVLTIPFAVIGREYLQGKTCPSAEREPFDAPIPTILLPGYTTSPKLPLDVLEVMARLSCRGNHARVVFAGYCSMRAELERVSELLNITGQVIFTDALGSQDFHEVLSRCSICVCLRDPTAGESSATLWQAMAHGKPCVVVDHGSYGEIPDGTVAKVSPGSHLLNELEDVLHKLIQDPLLAWTMGREAQRYIEKEHGPEQVAEGYSIAIQRFLDAR